MKKIKRKRLRAQDTQPAIIEVNPPAASLSSQAHVVTKPQLAGESLKATSKKRKGSLKLSDDEDADYYAPTSLLNSDDTEEFCECDDSSFSFPPTPLPKKLMAMQKLKKQQKELVTQIANSSVKLEVWRQLEQEGFEDFFNAGWIVDNSSLSTMKFRVEDFLIFLQSKISNANLNVVNLITNFLREDIGKYNEYLLQLKELQQLSPYTVRNYSKDIIKFLEWFVVIRKKSKSSKQVRGRHWELFLRMVKQTLKSIRKEIRIKQSENSIEALIQRNEWPAGGLIELQNAIRKDMDWVYNMARSNSVPTNKNVYNRYMNLLSASIYSFSCQGRVGGIEDLKFFQGQELLDENVVLTSKFKTNAKFGYQPVTLPADKQSSFLLHFYLTNVRPRLLEGHDDPLFINFAGTGPYNVAKGLSNFFAQSLGLKITSTRIRSIVETCFEDLLDNGAISTAQRNAIQNVNGHSSQTMKDHYLKKSRRQDAENAFVAFNVYDDLNGIINENLEVSDLGNDLNSFFENEMEFAGMETLNDSQTQNDLAVYPISVVAANTTLAGVNQSEVISDTNMLSGVVGCKHPDYKKSEKQLRASWTDFEIQTVGQWCEQNKIVNPKWAKCILAKCVQHIKNDPKLREHFHEFHIFDSGRLRHGWEAYLNKKKKT